MKVRSAGEQDEMVVLKAQIETLQTRLNEQDERITELSKKRKGDRP
jgi:hypothetical protein